MTTYELLIKEYDEDKIKHDRGETVNLLELMFKGYALDAVDTSKQLFKVELDFSEDSIKKVEKILDALSRSLVRDKPTNEQIMRFAKLYTGYIGQIIKLKWNGEWIEEKEHEIKNGPVLKVRNTDLFLLSKIYRRITAGSEDNIWLFYQVIRSDFEGSDPIKEETLKRKKKDSLIKRIFGR